MGLMRFVFSSAPIWDEAVRQAYLTGFDRVPWPVGVRQVDGELVLERSASDSGNLHIPWHVEGHGCLTLSTATLMERPEPYHLPLELARGKLGQIRNQMAEWQMIGLIVPQEVHDQVAVARRSFAHAAVNDHRSADSVAKAQEAIRQALEAADLLAAAYCAQALAVRRRASEREPVLLGVNLGCSALDPITATETAGAFNAGNVPLTWREIETSQGRFHWEIPDRQVAWCQSQNMAVCAGPLLKFDSHSIPDWITLYEDDFDSVVGFAEEFVESAVSRYRGKVDLWVCASRINTADMLSLSEEDTVRLAARVIELTRAGDPDTPALAAFDQPWAEYLSRRTMEYPPLHSADALVRADLGLAGVMLDVNVGYHPGGSMLRDPIEFNQQLDYWNLLGVPLYVSLTVPSSAGDDPLAQRAARLSQEGWSVTSQQSWVRRFVPLLLAKPYIRGVFWGQLRDAEPHEFPHGGLFDLRRHLKPALRQLAALRRTHLS